MSEKIFVSFGTRPEAIKLAPLIIELKKESGFSLYVCHSGQHSTLADDVLDFFKIIPDKNLRICEGKSDITNLTANALLAYAEVILTVNPKIVIVHGDTLTAFASALAAFYQKIPIVHIEAGLRSFDVNSPFPEEWNRAAIDLIADYCFAPTIAAKDNLISLRKKEENIFVVGNTVTDALRYTVTASYKNALLEKGKKIILFTAHRRENIGRPILNMCLAVRRIAAEYPSLKIICPMHPNPAVRSLIVPNLSGVENVILSEPMSVYDFQNVLSKSFLVLSDSGGIQEEAATLGVPMLIMRDTTERSEGCMSGIMKLVGTETDEIYINTKRLIESREEYIKMRSSAYSYGDGRVSSQIVKILKEKIKF